MKLAVVSVLALETCGLELHHHANPVRKVVNMLQMMQQKVEAEGTKERELHEKYMCYCNTGAATLGKTVEEYTDKIPALQAAIKDAQERNGQIKTTLEGHKADRAEAKKAMSEATGLRERTAQAYKKESEETHVELSATTTAERALMKGGSAFLQTGLAQTLKQLVMEKESMDAADRDDVLSFLSNGEAPGGGTLEIIGILKEMIAEYEKDLAEAKAAEASSIRTFEGLLQAKTQEVDSLTKMIETKLVRSGDLDVEIATNQNDLGDVEEALGDDQKFLVEMEKGCGSASDLYAENAKLRQQEVLAIAETIKVLNDDDALELFKKTLPGAGSSFLQIAVTSADVRQRAVDVLRQARDGSSRPVELDFIAVALDGKKVGFDKIIAHIDDMVAELGKEQQDDADKKEYCHIKMDAFDDKKKALERDIKDLSTSMTDAKEQILKLGEECGDLEGGIRSLDKQVAEGTAQRKEESSDFLSRQTSNNAAKQLLEFAKNRLNKFYNPKQYKPEATPDDALFLQKGRGAPRPSPEALLAYKKKAEESSGVIQMINVLIADLEKDTAEAEVTEKDAQGDYEAMLADAKEKRIADVKTLEEKSDARTQLIAAVDDYKGSKSIAGKTLGATEQAISNLHGECDFLLKYFDVRKEARANEVEALKKCKAVLNGADDA